MARFLMSPGVHVREIDQSQYASSAPTGNVAALVGYAEKGPFEPTIVGGAQDFEQRFGKTLADSPYLAQTAKKYFAQGSSVLVVRAGDSREPELYPSAAQYASKTVRIDSSTVSASKGYQEFKRASSLPPGSFAPNTTFEADVVADHRAFLEPMHMETWSSQMMWTSADGTPIPWDAQPTDLNEGEVKIAMPEETDNSFEVDYKVIHEGNGSFGQYYGTGTRSGRGHGKTISAMVKLYHMNSGYSAAGTDGSDNTQLSGVYQAAVVGSVDFATGASWAGSPTDFVIGLGNEQYTVSLNQDVADPSAVVAFLNDTALTSATDSNGGSADISNKVESFIMSNASGEAFICLKHISNTEDGFEIVSSPFGWQNKSYADTNTVVGTWRSETTDGSYYDGNVVLVKEDSKSGALSFVDTLTVQATSPGTGSWTLNDIASQVQDSLEAGWDRYPNSEARAVATVDDTSGKVRLTTSMTPADGQRALVKITSGGGNSLVDLLEGTTSMTVGKASHQEGDSLITLMAAEKGSYGNKLALRVETTEIQRAPGETEYLYNAFVLLDGKEVSGYQRVSWEDPSSEKYLPKLLEGDAYFRMEAEDEDGDSTLVKLPDGTWTLGDDQKANGVTDPDLNIVEFTVGTDGYVTDEAGSIESMSADFVKALEKIYNSEVYDYNLVSAPGDASSIVQNAITALCESRRDCFGLIDAAEFGLGIGVKNNINDVSEVNESVQNINSSYVGAYWPWLQDYDADNKQYIWLPPSTYALAQMAYTDNVSDPWFAAAGLRRGKVTALDVEYSPTRSDRDLLYGDTNIVNPIVSLVGEGIAIWGQKTGQRTASATDRINVRRLLIYAEKLIANMARGFLFEPNDESNWSAFARQANGILEPIRQRRGLYQYQVICDETTNTAALINQNTMAGKIFLQPMKTIEFVEVSFTITAYGVEFDEA